jgi:hypothetical protein
MIAYVATNVYYGVASSSSWSKFICKLKWASREGPPFKGEHRERA